MMQKLKLKNDGLFVVCYRFYDVDENHPNYGKVKNFIENTFEGSRHFSTSAWLVHSVNGGTHVFNSITLLIEKIMEIPKDDYTLFVTGLTNDYKIHNPREEEPA